MMLSFISSRAMLTCHPETYTTAVEQIEARAGWTEDNALALAYVLKGDLLRLRIPPPQPPLRADHLWQHTCFEAFVAPEGGVEYWEFNFAPSGQWAAYQFQRYRDGISLEDDVPAPKITVRNLTDRLDLHAIVYFDRLRTFRSGVHLKLALSAVIEDQNGMLSYWALWHPAGKPDFHHRDSFVLGLEPSGVTGINDPGYLGKR